MIVLISSIYEIYLDYSTDPSFMNWRKYIMVTKTEDNFFIGQQFKDLFIVMS